MVWGVAFWSWTVWGTIYNNILFFLLDATAEREVLEETGIKSGQFIYVIMCSIKT